MPLRSLLEPAPETVNDLVLAAALLAELRTRTDRAHETWWISMRYRPAAPAAVVARSEMLTLLEDVDWIMKIHSLLWS
ncbi:MAG: hypothetical protein ACREJ3_06260 [Polyangiaceae bacterium]